jgi:hypothetical protein
MANTTTDSVGQELLLEVWQQQCYSEFVMKDIKAALTTMSDNPHVLMGPITAGGRGSRKARHCALSHLLQSLRSGSF